MNRIEGYGSKQGTPRGKGNYRRLWRGGADRKRKREDGDETADGASAAPALADEDD